MKTIICISAKCSDLFSATLKRDGKVIGEYSGYVPDFLGSDGDYIELDIEIISGKIINWRKPSAAQLKIFQAGSTS